MENENANVKKGSKGLIIGLIAAAVVILAAVILFVFKPWDDGSVATVDNIKISKQEYIFFSKINMSQFLSSIQANQNTTLANYDWSTKKGSETAKDAVKKSTLEQIQELKIQILKAKEAGMKLEKTDLDSVDKFIDDQITEYKGRNAAETAIKETYGITLSELKDVYKDLTLAGKYRDSITSKVTASDDDAKKYYDENKKEFDKVTVTHILIKTVDANDVPVTAGKKAEAKKKADELLAKVRAGEDIKALAEKNSEDPGVTENKGEYTFGQGDSYLEEFKEWAFRDHKPGDADIVETSVGYHVMQFQKRVETPYDDLKANIKSGLTSQKQSEEFTKKMDEFKKDAKYSVKPNESAIAAIDKTLYKF